MRILALCARFPPDHLGGYELACSDVMRGLIDRGHECAVLTARFGRRERAETQGRLRVERRLDYVPLPQAQAEGRARRLIREWRNQAACRDVLKRFRPDVVSVWDLWGLLPSLIQVCGRAGVAVTYAVSSPWAVDYRANPDRWAATWQARPEHPIRAGARELARRAVSGWLVTEQAAPDPSPGFFVSESLRCAHVEAGFDVGESPVIHLGVDAELFTPSSPAASSTLRLLYAGRVVAEKGVDTAIEALYLLGDRQATLDVVGPEPDAAYLARLRRQVSELGLGSRVRFKGPRPRGTMPRVYRSHHVLLFPSVWDEPFALTLLEAMACGLPIVGTGTGGSREAIEDTVTGLIFPAGDAGAMAGCIRRLVEDADLRRELGGEARARVERDFRLEPMVEMVERFLLEHEQQEE